MPAREISMKEAVESILHRANGSARRLTDIANDLQKLAEQLPDPDDEYLKAVSALVKTQATRIREEVRSLNGG